MVMSHSAPQAKKRRRDGSCLAQDFKLLASRYPEFAKEFKSLEYKQNNKSLSTATTRPFQLALTRALLDCHFELKLPSLPDHHLCPPVPNRWFHCSWIVQDLMNTTCDCYFDNGAPVQIHNKGLDIGTGASAIYALLMTKHDSNLTMLASDIDASSLKSAKCNITANGLQDQIQLIHVSSESKGGPLLQALGDGDIKLDFIMTNPPFFAEQPPPRADGRDRTSMTNTESIYPDGGEVGFVLDIINDSLITLDCITWYTTMLAKKKSLVTLRNVLRIFLGPGQVQFTELEFGQTTRWFLAWTFQRPHTTSPLAKSANEKEFLVNDSSGIEVAARVVTYMESMPGYKLVCEQEQEDGASIQIRATEQDFIVSNDAASRLPDRIVNAKNIKNIKWWLPTKGHFSIVITISTSGNVTVESYQHSKTGEMAIAKILNRFQGEICRTNRKWRRLLARQPALQATK